MLKSELLGSSVGEKPPSELERGDEAAFSDRIGGERGIDRERRTKVLHPSRGWEYPDRVGMAKTEIPDKWFFTRGADWAVGLINGFLSNPIKPSVKAGSYKPDTTAAPFESLRAYKGRSLNGIWATAPYLHNGSVPTLYDLLLPASPKENDPPDPPETQYRPQKFMVGSRELDATKVGFKHGENEYDGFLFDTTKPSNSNAGHEYGTREMTDKDRWDLVEFLKSL